MNHRQAPTVRIRRGAGDAVEPDAGSAEAFANDGAHSSTMPAPPESPVPPASAVELSVPHVAQVAKAPAVPVFRADALSPAEVLAARLPEGYRLVQLAHEGQWADVWKATDDEGRRVALKLARAGGHETAARFAAEARTVASLTHRSIVRLHTHGETSDHRPFLALEWLEGPSLARALADRAAGLPPGDAVRLLMPIAYALLLAHDRGAIHGDVRAEHVMLVPLPGDRILPKLIDFGGTMRIPALAQKPRPSEPTRQAPPSSPSGAEGDPAADVRAFAALIFHAIMGHPPFASGPVRGSAPPPEVPRSGLSERDAALWRVLAEGLAPLSVKRRQSLHDFTKALAQWADLRGVESDITGSSILTRWSGALISGARGGPPPEDDGE